MIYELTFNCAPIDESAMRPNNREVGRKGHLSASDRQAPVMENALALLYVNHQVSAEATSTLYRTSAFSGCPCGFTNFLSDIGPHRYAIKNLTLRTNFSGQEAPCLEHLSQAVVSFSTMEKLATLVINCEHSYFAEVQKKLVDCGIDKLPARIAVTVKNDYRPGTQGGTNLFKCTNTWECAKGDNIWTGGENQWRLNRQWCEESQHWVEAGA